MGNSAGARGPPLCSPLARYAITGSAPLFDIKPDSDHCTVTSSAQRELSSLADDERETHVLPRCLDEKIVKSDADPWRYSVVRRPRWRKRNVESLGLWGDAPVDNNHSGYIVVGKIM